MLFVFFLQPTYLFVVPSLLLFLASHPAVKTEYLSSIKEVTCGAAPATKGLIDKFKEKVGRTDLTIRQGKIFSKNWNKTSKLQVFFNDN